MALPVAQGTGTFDGQAGTFDGGRLALAVAAFGTRGDSAGTDGTNAIP